MSKYVSWKTLLPVGFVIWLIGKKLGINYNPGFLVYVLKVTGIIFFISGIVDLVKRKIFKSIESLPVKENGVKYSSLEISLFFTWVISTAIFATIFGKFLVSPLGLTMLLSQTFLFVIIPIALIPHFTILIDRKSEKQISKIRLFASAQFIFLVYYALVLSIPSYYLRYLINWIF